MAIAYRSVLGGGGDFHVDSLIVTTMPTKTAYIKGQSLDTTGLVITGSAMGMSGNVTQYCTFSPTVLNTAGTQTITVSFGDATTTFNVTVAQATSLTITTPPTKTSYKPNEQLDLTGIVVTASGAGLSEDVTADCTFSPAEGTTLTTEGTFTLTASFDGLTATTNYVVKDISIYGVEWDGSSSPAWTRTDDAASFSDPQPYYSGMSGTPSSPFDNLMPWSGMVIEEDADLGTLVKIPKFWYKWTRNGASMKLQISDGEQTETGWHVSPAHADRGDGTGERDYVYVGRYHCAANTYKSTSGVKPQVSMTRDTARTAISNLHAKAWQWDFAMWWTINMLYLVEFANWNSQAKIGGGCSETSTTSSAVYNMGSTDSMPYHTGTVASSIGAAVYGATQYRHIENLWGNCYDWCDGIYFSGADVYAINNPANFSDTTGGTKVSERPTTSNEIKAWSTPSASGLEYALYPSEVENNTNYDTYVCDRCYYNASGVVLFVGGNYYQNQNYGAFFLYGNFTASGTNANIGSRLQKLP